MCQRLWMRNLVIGLFVFRAFSGKGNPPMRALGEPCPNRLGRVHFRFLMLEILSQQPLRWFILGLIPVEQWPSIGRK